MSDVDNGQQDFSWVTFDESFLHFVKMIQPERVLDIGAGSGKYGKLVRSIKSDVHITGVEIDQGVIAKHNLHSIYDEMAPELAMDFLLKNPLKNFDLVIIGDCIEHMKKSEGIDLLNLLNYRSSFIYVVTPDGMVMNKDPYYFGHISNWTERDLMWHDNFAYDRVSVLQVFLMRGLLRTNHPSMAHIINEINAKEFLLCTPNDEGSQKKLRLTYVDQMKCWEISPGVRGGYRAF